MMSDAMKITLTDYCHQSTLSEQLKRPVGKADFAAAEGYTPLIEICAVGNSVVQFSLFVCNTPIDLCQTVFETSDLVQNCFSLFLVVGNTDEQTHNF